MRTRRVAALVASAVAVTAAIPVVLGAPVVASPAGDQVVISEVYGGGGNSGAMFTHDYVELFNPTSADVCLDGWRVQYFSAAGTAAVSPVATLTGRIPAGGYYLVQQQAGAGGTTPLPTPNLVNGGGVAMSATNGRVQLLSPAPAAAPVDLVGYGSANAAETAPAPTLSNTTAAIRNGGGAADTDNNSVDFAAGAPDPDNSAAAPCGATNQPPVVVAPAALTTTQGTPASTTVSATDADGTVTSLAITSPAALPPGVTFTSTGAASGTLAVDATAAPAELAVTFTATDDGSATGDATTMVTIGGGDACGAPVTHQIAQVQGSGQSSPLGGQTGVRIEGVVTGDFQAPGLVGGFYLQDDTPDDDPTTSDGALVFDNTTAVNPGDRVRVTGRVIEFRRTSDQLSGTVTELTSTSTLAVCGTGAIAAAPLVLPVPTLETFESYEGVLVNVPAGLTATELFSWARFGEVSVSSGGRLYSPTNGQGSSAEENDRRRILLDDTRSTQNPPTLPYLRTGRTIPRLGDTLNETVTGVFTYEFDQYRVQPTENVVDRVLLGAAGPRPAAPDPVGGDVQVSTFNALNYFTTIDTAGDQGEAGLDDEPRGADTEAELTRQRDKLIPAIVGLDADVLGLIEIENSSGGALQDLVDRVNAAQPGVADDYSTVAEPDLGLAPNAYGGAFGTDLIKVAIIYRPAVVTPIGAAVSSGDPVHNRPPLAQTFELVGGSEAFTTIMNHFKSKGSCPDRGEDPANDDLGQGCWNALRVQQALAVVELASDEPNPILLGDLNANGEEDPVHVIEDAGYANVSESFIPLPDRYSYVFEGEAGELDHALVGGDLADRVTGADIWHINSDEPAGIDYQDFNVDQAIDGDPVYSPDPFRSSDHDPLVFGLDPLQPPGAPASVSAAAGWSAATVSWTAPISGGQPSGYIVRALVSGAVVEETTTGPATRSVAIGPLDHGVVHSVEVAAVGTDGLSPPATTTVTPNRIPRDRFVTIRGPCQLPGNRTWTVTNTHGVAIGYEWGALPPVASGEGVVPARGSAVITARSDRRPAVIVLVSGGRVFGAGAAGPC